MTPTTERLTDNQRGALALEPRRKDVARCPALCVSLQLLWSAMTIVCLGCLMTGRHSTYGHSLQSCADVLRLSCTLCLLHASMLVKDKLCHAAVQTSLN